MDSNDNTQTVTGTPEEDDAIALAVEAQEKKREQEAEYDELLEQVSEESEADVDLIETQVDLWGYSVPIAVRRNGDLIDRLSWLQDQSKSLEDDPESGVSKVPEIMDTACQLLADAVDSEAWRAEHPDDQGWEKEAFYAVYREYGPDAIREGLEVVFSQVEEEVERRSGAADGFRKKP